VILSAQVVVPISLALARMRLMAYLSDDSDNGASSQATEDQHATQVRAGVAFLSGQVVVETLDPVMTGERTVVAVRWTAGGSTGALFPTLDANLDLRPGDPGETTIMLIGSFLPVRVLGAAVDRLVLHELATSTVRDFLTRIAARVTHPDSVSMSFPDRIRGPRRLLTRPTIQGPGHSGSLFPIAALTLASHSEHGPPPR
jgi:hypothetical protein